MEYKIGDKVRVREDLVVDQQYGKYIFSYSMIPFKGKIVTISGIIDSKYEIEEDFYQFWWTDEMFVGKESEEIKSNLEEIEEYFDSNEIYNPIDEFSVSAKESTSNFIIVKSNRLKLLLL